MGNTTYRISLSRQLQQDAQEAFSVVEDIERFPEFMPNVNRLKLLEDAGHVKVAEWDTEIDDTPLTWTEEGIYDRVARTVKFRAIDGVFDRFDGIWRVTPEGKGCRIEFELEYEIGLPEIEEMIAPLLHERLEANIESMIGAIALRAQKPA